MNPPAFFRPIGLGTLSGPCTLGAQCTQRRSTAVTCGSVSRLTFDLLILLCEAWFLTRPCHPVAKSLEQDERAAFQLGVACGYEKALDGI